jgi:urease accessory protein
MKVSEQGKSGVSAEFGILTLTQWFSPAYPVGAFAYSHGLETAIADGRIAGPGDLQDWLTDILQHGAGRADALFLAAAYEAKDTETLSEIDALNRAFQPSAERLMETDLQGAAFAEATNAVWGTALPRLTYPVAVGRAARLLDLPPDRTAQLYLHAATALRSDRQSLNETQLRRCGTRIFRT